MKHRLVATHTPMKRPPRREISFLVRVLGWRATMSVKVAAGRELHREASYGIQLVCELPESWKPRNFTVYVESGLYPANTECEVIASISGDKHGYAMLLTLTAEEYSFLCSVLGGSQPIQLALTGTRPKYRRSLVYSVHLETGSDRDALNPAEDIV